MELSKTEQAVRIQLLALQDELTAYSAVSVADTALQMLNEQKAWTLEDLQTLPWLVLLVTKWSLQDPRCQSFRGKKFSRQDMHRLCTAAWDQTGAAKSDAFSIMTMIRSSISVQVEFQRRPDWSFLRWACLIAKLPPDHDCQSQFFEVVCMSPEDFIDACILARMPQTDPSFVLNDANIGGLPTHHQRALRSLLSGWGANFIDLRIALSRERGSHPVSSRELFEFPFARLRPFIQMPGGSWQTWHPAALERGLDDGVHVRLSRLGQRYTDSFSAVFEEHVVEMAREAWPNLIDEAQWKERFGSRASSADALIGFDGTNVFLEVKMSKFNDAVILEDEPAKLASRLERVVDAVTQVRKASALLRRQKHLFPRRAQATEEFLLVVVSRELHVGGGRQLSELLPNGTLDADTDVSVRLPLENIFVLSIESFERLQQLALQSHLELVQMLRTAAQANRSPVTSSMYFDQHLTRHGRTNRSCPSVIEPSLNAAFERLEAAVGELAGRAYERKSP